MNVNRQLLATWWTWAGEISPLRMNDPSPVGIHERLQAVADAGWSGVSFIHSDVARLRDSVGLDTLKSLLDDHGLHQVELECVSNWWTDGDDRRASDGVRAELFSAAGPLGVTTVKAAPELHGFGRREGVPYGRFADEFGALADEAKSHGLRIAIEPMVMSNLRSVEDGANFVGYVGHSHGGLVVDAWQVARGGHSPGELEDILPMDQVFIVELDDGDAEAKADFWTETLNNRAIPGDGQMDTVAFVAALVKAGWTGHWGVEVLSSDLRALPVAEAATLVHDKTTAVLEAAEATLRIMNEHTTTGG